MELFYLQQIIKGEVSHFSYFIEKYKHAAYSLAFRIINNREDAEEVVQDSFLKAFNSLHKFRHDARFSTWFYKIVINTSLSKTRSRKFSESNIDVHEITNNCIENIESVYKNLTHTEQKKFINDALQDLATQDSILLTLYYLHECSIEEITEITGINKENVKMKLHRARKKMYLALQKNLKSEFQSIL
jgi:RNA polymerase sigma factor (sigma-70 family)